MAPSGGQTTVGLTVAANMDVSGILNGVKSMQGAFNGLKLPANLTGDAIKQFDKLKESLTKYRELMEKGPSTKADLKQLEKLEKIIKSSFSDLSKIYDEFSNKKIYLEADATAIKNAQKDIDQLKQDVQNKLGSIKFEFSSPTKGKVDIGLNDLVSDMERAVKSSKTVSASMKEMTNSVKSGNFTDAAKGLVQIEQQASKLKGASIGLLKTFQQMGLIQFNKSAEDLYKSGQHVTLLHQGFEKLRGALSADDAELKQFVKSLEDAVTKKGELEKIGETNYRNSLGTEKQKIDGLAQGYNQCADAARGFAQQTLSATQQVEQLQQSTQYFFSLRNMINLLKRGIDEAVQSVKDLDKAMTETAVVTDYKVSDLWGMLPEYTRVANELGATTQGAYETMTLYYQQGLEQQQAFELGAETMKMARIAGLDYAETTDMMTAALRGFNMELNETSAKRVNDVYSELAAITASDTEELGTAMQRTASIAASAGASFEGTTAFLAQAIETTREPAENIGTAMKTIVARFQELKKNPLEISEVEGEEVDYNKIDTALKTIGVDLKDANGQFRDFDQVMLDISARWDSLSQAQQRYIATTAAGSRQQSRFIAMVSNYDRTMQLMEAANNSAGASDEQFGKTMDSLESKLNKLHNAWQQFTMGIANNGMIKLAVDGLTGFLNITNKIIDTLSLGSGVFKSFLSVFAAFTGLKIAGRVANSLIGGLGGLVDPQSTVKEGLTTGLFGQGKNNAQAKAITTPIVSSLNKISQQIAQIKNGKIGDDSNQSGQIRNTSKQEYLDIKKQFDKLSGKEGFKISEASSLFGQLDAKHQQAMFNNSPGTKAAMKKASMAWFDSQGLSKELTNEGKQYINSIYKGMKEGQIPVDKGIELIGRPDLWGEHFATDAAKTFSDQYVKNLTVNESDLRAASEAMIEQFSTEQIAAMSKEDYNKQADKLAQEFAAKRIGKEYGKTKGTVTDMGRFANDIGAVADKFTQAGYGITTFGNALSQLGGPLGMVGNGIAALGGAISTIGASISGATGIISLFTEGLVAANGTVLVAGSTIAAVAAPLAALAAGFLLVRHHIKKVKEAGEEVTKTFNDVNKETQDNITKLKSYQGEFTSLSQGVDINGNNVSLDDSQYQRYLEIVDDIATINPAIVKGYNAQGHAILDNNIALEETLRLQEQLQKEAYKTYLSEGSLQALINARNVNTDYGKAVKNLYGGKLEDSGKAGKVSPLTNDVQLLADKLNLSGDRKAAEHILEKYGIESLDALIKGEEQAVKKFVNYQDQIQADLSNFGVDLSEEVIKGFQTLGENTEAFEAAIKPVYDNLLALVSNSSAYKDLAPEMRSALAEGLKGIASQDLGAKEMQQAANYLMLEFQDAFDKAQPYLDQADEALNTFTQDLDEAAYNDSASNIAENLRELAHQAEAVGQVEIAEWYENQASRIEDAITGATYSIADGVDTLADNIAKAKANFDSLAEGIDDYYTLTDKARGLVDTALEDKNTGGNGSKTFWRTYQGLASEEAFDRHNLDEAISDMKQFQKYFAEGVEGASAFGQKLIDSQDKAFKFTDNTGKETTKHVRDFFKLADDGTMQITDEFKNLSDEQYSQLAAAFKLSDDGFTAILNNLRQWGDIDFSDPGLIRKALATDTRSVTTNKKVAVDGEKNKVSRLYYGESTLQAETPEMSKNERTNLVKDLEVQGSIRLPSGADALIKAPSTVEGKDTGGLLKQFVEDTKGTGNQVQNVMAALIKSGEYNKEDLEKIHQSIVDQNLLAGAKDVNKDFEDVYSAAELQVTDPATEAANEHLSNISSTVNTIAGIVAAGKVGEGYLPDVAKQSNNLYNELVGKKGKVDTWAQQFAKGRDENGYAITDKAKYNEIYAKLDEYKTANDNYINELKEGKAAAEERGASVAELEAFDEEIAAAEQNAKLIDFYFQSAKSSAEKVETDFYNAGQTVFQGFADIRNNSNLTPAEQKTQTADVLTDFANKLQGLNFSPEQIQGIFKENFGIELELKGNEFATDVGEQINEQIKGLDTAEINAVLNIASIKMATAARGKNNTPSAIRRVGTMARGSKKHGYTVNGEPTLTGELGPELVWEPRQNAAYMVGEHGPQFTNLSKNAVVWNAQQTKKIKKNSKGVNSLGTGARGIHSFGTMAGGNIGGTKIPGTLEVDANANILDVIPPSTTPEIPVKAKLEVENGNKGGLLSKIFGNKKGGPSIDVAANVTSINTGEQLQTIQVIGNITKLNNEATVDGINATATVTQVTKAPQIAGEPITVKAIATTTQVKNQTPTKEDTPKPQTQTVNVTADTSKAQAKINQLISIFNRTYTLRYSASGPSSISVPITPDFRGIWKKTVEIDRSGAHGINNYIGNYSGPSFGSAAKGKYGTLGPKGKGGLTLTGEKGFEIAWLPSENRSMVLGVDGPQMLNLPSDAVVYTHEQSKEILKRKGIPAGSHSEEGSNSVRGNDILKYLNVSPTKTPAKKTVVKKKNKDKDDKRRKKNTDDAAKVIKKAGKISAWWWNMGKKVEATQRIIDKTYKKIDKLINKAGTTFEDLAKDGKLYIDKINKQIELNTKMKDKATNSLKTLDTGTKYDKKATAARKKVEAAEKKLKKAKKTKSKKDDKEARQELKKAKRDLKKAKKLAKKKGGTNYATISYDLTKVTKDKNGKIKKTKKPKKEKINLSSYIKKDKSGAYVVDDKKINKQNWDKSKKKAVMEAAQKKIDTSTKRKYDAEDAIEKQEEALKEWGEKLYEAFHGWENELTKIYFLTQQIAEMESRVSALKSMESLQENRLLSGLQTLTEQFKKESLAYFQGTAKGTVRNLENRNQLIDIKRQDLIGLVQAKAQKEDYIKLSEQLKTAKDPQEILMLRAGLDKLGGELKAINLAQKYINPLIRSDGTIDLQFKAEKFNEDRMGSNPELNTASAEIIQKYIKDIEEGNQDLLSMYEEQISGLNELYESLTSLQQKYADYSEELLKAIEDEAQERVDKIKGLSDAINDNFKELIDNVKSRLEERRQQEDNSKTERDITKKQNRLALLRANSAGGNVVAAAQLEQEIADAQQSYGRTLEDQLLDKLQNSSDKAEKQRERQIELANAMLELNKVNGTNVALVSKYLGEPERYQTRIVELIKDARGYNTATEQSRAILDGQIKTMLADLDRETGIPRKIEDVKDEIGRAENAVAQALANFAMGAAQQTGVDTSSIMEGVDPTEPIEEDNELETKLTKAEAEVKYKEALLNAEKNKKTSYKEIQNLKEVGKAAGIPLGKVLKDLAGTPGITWKQILTAVKGHYSKYRLAYSFDSDTFKTAYDAVYGPGEYKKNRKYAADHKKDYPKYKFAVGGLADYTGPAWLDGTPSKPELVLNSTDTKNLIALKDVLSKVMKGSLTTTTENQGDILYEININVDKIEKDYDVDQVVDKVKKEIVKSAGYRNVTQVRNFR